MQIFAGSMIGIRTTKAHGNLSPDSTKVLQLISLVSLVMHNIVRGRSREMREMSTGSNASIDPAEEQHANDNMA